MRRCLLLGILKAGFRIFFYLYIYLFTLERFIILLLLLLVIWLVELKLRFYDKIIISIYFFISRVKWKRRCLLLGALKISVAAFIYHSCYYCSYKCKVYANEQILDIAYIRNIQKMLILLKQNFFLLTWTTIENISKAKFKYIRRDEKDISFKG